MYGGLASSTATTLVYAKHGKNNSTLQDLAASIIVIASMVVLFRLLMVTSVLAYGKLPALIPIFSCGLIAGLAVALYHWRKLKQATELYLPETTNPAEMHTALGFATLYVVVLLITAWMVDVAGSQGLYAVAFASGLTDVDAIVLSSLRLFNLGQLSQQQTVMAITIGFLSNLAFKFGVVIFIGGWQLARKVAIGFSIIAIGILFGVIIS